MAGLLRQDGSRIQQLRVKDRDLINTSKDKRAYLSIKRHTCKLQCKLQCPELERRLHSSDLYCCTDPSSEFFNITSSAVIIHLICSRLTTIAFSRPNIVEGFINKGSRSLRSLEGKEQRLITVNLSSSTIFEFPLGSIRIHDRLPRL
ncbi:chloroplast import apparatus 2 [Striga asiatica]|uniref:Chloroplast import apparatus 2 n=1 Tax=Striga asiatica TaxID=4170 RepID=A0A5A7QFN8_STRAF|nr:chloroplast import apparatus 2 [Striga asiatica]